MTRISRPHFSPLWAGRLITSGLAPLYSGAATGNDTLTVVFDAGLVSLSASGAAAGDVVEAIADQAGLLLVKHVQLDRPVTLSVDKQPLPDVLAAILENDSYMLLQTTQLDNAGAGFVPGILWVFSAGSAHAPATTIIFEAALYNGDYREKTLTIAKLRRLGTPAAVQTLSLALGDDDSRIRDQALRALSRIGGDDALAAIASATMDSESRVRAEAATALAAGDVDTAAQYLALVVDDPDPQVRVAAVESLADVPLGTVPSRHAVTMLTRALHDENRDVRMAVVDAMEGIGGSIAYQVLMQARMDADPEVAEVVNELLLSLGDSD